MSVQLGNWEGGKLYIEGLQYEFPKKPSKKEMINHGKPVKEQLWTRSYEHEKFDWSNGWEDVLEDNPKQLEYIVREIKRLHEGAWVLIEGEEVYLNNFMYFFLQWYMLEDGSYPDFRDSALYYYRFMEICQKAKLCAGHTLLKARRLGATSMTLSALQLGLLIKRNSNFGIVSNKGDSAKKAFARAVKSMGNLPSFLRPTQEGTTAPKQVLSLKEQAKRISKDNKNGSAQGGLNNELSWQNTDLNSYDSYALADLLLDECLSPETKIMMGDGTFRKIDDIKVGDYVMTEGSVPRKVMERFDGYDNMFLVKQPYGIDYKVNSKHRLIIEHRMGGGNSNDGRYILTPEELLNKFSKSSYRVINRVTSKGVDFEKVELPIDSYLLGLWLGDGFADGMNFIVNDKEDPEILQYLIDYCDKNNNGVYSIRPFSKTKNAIRFSILRPNGGAYNPHVTKLRNLNLYDNKHIPEIYMKSSIEDRLALLAGIIDTDGHNSLNHKTKKPKGSFDIAMSRLQMIEQIQYLAMSCGLSVSKIRHKKSNFNTDVYKISISGDLGRIPTLVKRKQYNDYNKQYNSRRNKISVEPCGVGRYVGIQVEAYKDEDRQLILEDFTLTMNCGKYPKDVPIDKYLPIVIKCLKKGAKIVGKIMAPTTVNPPHAGGAEYREVWDNSDQSKADYLGQTKTGLYRIFIPAYIGFDGYILPSGKSVWDTPTPEESKLLAQNDGCPDPTIGAKEYLNNMRKNLENDVEALQEEIRMNPFSAEEVFESANERCIFNLTNLNKRENELIEELLDKGLSVKNGELGRRGWFRKRGEKVVFEDDPVGLWHIHYMLPANQSNLYRYVGNEKEPTNQAFGAGGMDGYVSGQATVDKGSDGCLIIRSRKTTSLPDEYSGVPVAMLLGRMENVDEFYEQAYNGLIFYGVKMLCERTPLTFEEYAKKHNLTRYLYGTTRSDGSKVLGIPAQQSKSTIEAHAKAQVMSSLDDHYKIPFIRLVRDRKSFSTKDRTQWDACISDGYSLMALEYEVLEIKKANSNIKYIRKGRIIR